MRTISEANKVLREDLVNEQKRYKFLENKYKELLVKYNVASTHLEEKEKTVFAMSTGANYDNYPHIQQKKPKKKRPDMDFKF